MIGTPWADLAALRLLCHHHTEGASSLIAPTQQWPCPPAAPLLRRRCSLCGPDLGTCADTTARRAPSGHGLRRTGGAVVLANLGAYLRAHDGLDDTPRRSRSAPGRLRRDAASGQGRVGRARESRACSGRPATRRR